MNRIEVYDTYKGYEYIVYAYKLGHRYGYVKIPERHTLYEMDYIDIEDKFNIEVHGGLTFSGFITGFIDGLILQERCWWIGFDCNHLGDLKDFGIMSNEYKETYQHIPQFYGTIKTKEYVENECKKLIDQIKNLTTRKDLLRQ